MRIALVLPGFSANSDDWAIPALLNLARQLAREHEIHIFSQRYPAAGTYHFDGLAHHALGGGQKFGAASAKIWLQSSRAIVQQHRQTPFDLLHAFWADEAGFSAALAGASIKRPVIVSLGGGELTRLPDIHYGAQRFFMRRLTTNFALKKAAKITAGSAYQLNLCRAHHISNHKLCLAPLGVDTTRFTAPHPASQPRPALIQVASLLPVKNQQLLLDILSLVKKEIPAIHLHLAGDGPDQHRLRQYSDTLKLKDTITWHGQIPYPTMPKLYPQASLYLQSSLHESQGMAVLEAMACGLPVLGTPVGVVQDVACQPAVFDKVTLAAQVIELLTTPANYILHQQQARQIVEESFSLTATTRNFLRIYEGLYTTV